MRSLTYAALALLGRPASALAVQRGRASGAADAVVSVSGRGQVSWQPDSDGRRLSDHDLRAIHSISCLKDKQRAGADASCHGRFTIGSYPSWNDPRCRSLGNYVCDPDASLDLAELANISNALAAFQKSVNVTCGHVAAPQTRGGSNGDFHPFQLGVAIVEDWPSAQSDPATLQKLGMALLQRWGFAPVYNGVNVSGSAGEPQVSVSNCPLAAAILIAVPASRVLHVAAPNCDYVCQDRIAPDIVAAVEGAWRDGKPTGVALEAGITTATRMLENVSTPHVSLTLKEQVVRELNAAFPEEFCWKAAQRGVLVLMIVMFACCLGGFITNVVLPKPGNIDPQR